jgi:hypothetical protein
MLNLNYRNISVTLHSSHMYVLSVISRAAMPLNHINSSAAGKLLHRRAHMPYIFSLVLLWISITSSFIISWVMNRSAFVVHNGSPISILSAVNALPLAAGFVPMFVANIVSDGILVMILQFVSVEIT